MFTNNDAGTESVEQDDVVMNDTNRQDLKVASTDSLTRSRQIVTIGELIEQHIMADSHPESNMETAQDVRSNYRDGDIQLNNIDLSIPKLSQVNREELKLMEPSLDTNNELLNTHLKVTHCDYTGYSANDPTGKSCLKLLQGEKRKSGKSEKESDSDARSTVLEPLVNEQSSISSTPTPNPYCKFKRSKMIIYGITDNLHADDDVSCDIGTAPDSGSSVQANQTHLGKSQAEGDRKEFSSKQLHAEKEQDLKTDNKIALMAFSNPIAGPSSAVEDKSVNDDKPHEIIFWGPCHHSSSRVLDGVCQMPCGAQLECGDMCSGTCGTCHSGRIHQLCTEPCDKELICGHKCESLCKDYCPPCLKPCPIFCPHGPCPLTCSEPCMPCEEPCGWKCQHFSCSRKCGEECDRRLCSERCKRKLFCGHACVGICGEPCPPCRTCRPQAFPRIFQTEEEEDDEKGKPRSRYILLMCGHSVEITGLIKWWSSPEVQDENTQNRQHQQVTMARCPACRKVQTCRYLPTVRSTLQLIQLGKTELWWSRVQALDEELTTIITEIRAELERQFLIPISAFSGNFFKFLNNDIMTKINSLKSGKGRRTNHSMSVHLFRMKCLQKMIWTLVKFWKAYDDRVRDALMKNMTILFNKMEFFNNLERFGKQQFSDFMNETYRFCHQAQLSYLALHSGYYNNKSRDDIKQLFEKIKNRLDSSARYTVATSKENDLDLEKLGETVKVAPLISEEEKNMLYSVFPELRSFLHFNRGQGYLYKCPEGHVYFIGNCGQAEVASVCNLCNEKIGGAHHELKHGSAYDLNELNHLRPPNLRPVFTKYLRRERVGNTYMMNTGLPFNQGPARLKRRASQLGQVRREMDFFTRVMSESKRKPRCVQSCGIVERRTLVGDLSWRMRRVSETLQIQRQMQDNALEDLYEDLRHQIMTASHERLGQLRLAFDKDLPPAVFERGQCFGCMVQGAIPEGVRLTQNNVYEVMAHGHCQNSRAIDIPAQETVNGQAATGLTLEQLKADILKEVEAKLDTLKPYFNQTQSLDLEQPGPSGVSAVSSSDPAPTAQPGPAPTAQPGPAASAQSDLDVAVAGGNLDDSIIAKSFASIPELASDRCKLEDNMVDYDWLVNPEEYNGEMIISDDDDSLTTDSD